MDLEGSASSSEENVETTTESIYGNLTTIKAIRSMDEDDFNSLIGVYIEPPDVNVNSDEEPSEEELRDADTPRNELRYDNLSKQHYETYAELVLVKHKRLIAVEKDYEIPKPRKHEPFLWLDSQRKEIESSFPKPNYDAYLKKTPVQIFEQFFDKEVINYIIDETSMYAALKGCDIPILTPKELKTFVGLLLLSGVRGTSKELRCDLLVRAMQRNRFVEICNFIHFADNTKPDESDKMWKLRPLINLFKKRFVKMFQPEEHLTFGEYMADTCRRHNDTKWYDVPVGYKIWCLNSSDGYLIDFNIFQRKNPNALGYEAKFGVPGASLIQILDDLPKNISQMPFKIYFNKLFTSLALLVYLKERGYDGTGSMKESEIPKNCPLPTSKDMLPRNEGACEYSSDKNVMIATMKEQSVITVGTTCHDLHAEKVLMNKKQKIGPEYPSIFANYKMFKKGTTRMDEVLCKYGIKTEGKKWYWPLFTSLLDIAVNNSCILMQKSGIDITQVNFRRVLVAAYLKSGSDATAK